MSSLFTSVATRNISPINIGKFFFAYRSSLKTLFSEFCFAFFNPSRTVDRFRFVIFFFFFVIYIYICKRSIEKVNILFID